jgi:D-glycero-D-manno-heptose 1,7-bisphosphate phosphatase
VNGHRGPTGAVRGLHRRAVFLDRDGVLSRATGHDGRPGAPLAVADFEILPDAPTACGRLRAAGFLLVVVTNQPELARGALAPDQLAAMHDRLRAEVPVDDIRVCPHDDADGCGCRKPAPGLLTGAARHHGIDLAASVMVGDRWRDIEAGRRAGCRTVLVERGWLERRPEPADAEVAGIAEAAAWICGSPHPDHVPEEEPA